MGSTSSQYVTGVGSGSGGAAVSVPHAAHSGITAMASTFMRSSGCTRDASREALRSRTSRFHSGRPPLPAPEPRGSGGVVKPSNVVVRDGCATVQVTRAADLPGATIARAQHWTDDDTHMRIGVEVGWRAPWCVLMMTFTPTRSTIDVTAIESSLGFAGVER